MLRIGCHLSVAKGFYSMAQEAVKIKANTFQFFTRNPRGGKAKKIDEKDIQRCRELMVEKDITNILAHAPYTLNACSADEGIREFAFNTMKEDIERMEYFPGSCYNFHPGSHVGQGVDIGIEYISELLNRVLSKEQTTIVLLETMAGKGTEIGRNFEELRRILDNVELSEKMGVCIDTCHIFDGGYDIVNSLDDVLEEFDSIIGINRLYAIHLNDSKNILESHKDRHEKIGEGFIGIQGISNIINNYKLKGIPFYLETPNDLEGYAEEIKLLKEIYKCKECLDGG